MSTKSCFISDEQLRTLDEHDQLALTFDDKITLRCLGGYLIRLDEIDYMKQAYGLSLDAENLLLSNLRDC